MLIHINSKQKKFVLLDQIIDNQLSKIEAIKEFNNDPIFLAIEACAQLGAFHVRFLLDFSRHVFFMKLKNCEIPFIENLSGKYNFVGNLLAKSSDIYSYSIKMKKNNLLYLDGVFLFAVSDYNENFQRKHLENHYQQIFSQINF